MRAEHHFRVPGLAGRSLRFRLTALYGVLFFASGASRFVTGTQYNIDGGQLLGRAD